MSRQLGHASIKITVGTYYHWLPSQHIGEVSELDEIGKAGNNPQPIRNQKEQGAATEATTPLCTGAEGQNRTANTGIFMPNPRVS